jgi:hypothetical protein
MVHKAFFRGEASQVAVFAFPALVLSFGLLAGLAGVLELSSGILLMVSMASTIKYGGSGASFNPQLFSKNRTIGHHVK